jgi:ArsR family transcriptional regulator
MSKSVQDYIFEKVDQQMLDKASYIIRAISHPLRLKIISYIDKNKIVNVNKIYNSLSLEQSITSQHLNILRNSKLVTTRREGKFIFYSVNYSTVIKIFNLINEYNIK